MAVRDLFAFAHAATTSIGLWHGAGLTVDANAAISSGTFHATPYFGPPGTLAQAAIKVSIANSGYARCALYVSSGGPNIYPRSLLVDCGSFAVSSVNFVTNCVGHVLIDSGLLLWRIVWTNAIGGGVQLRQQSDHWAVLGSPGGISFSETETGFSCPYTGDMIGAGFPVTFPHSGLLATVGARTTFFLAYSAVT